MVVLADKKKKGKKNSSHALDMKITMWTMGAGRSQPDAGARRVEGGWRGKKKPLQAVEGGCSADYLHQSLRTHTIKMKVQSAGQLPEIRSHCWKGEKRTVSTLAGQAAKVLCKTSGEIRCAAALPWLLTYWVILIDFCVSRYATANLGELSRWYSVQGNCVERGYGRQLKSIIFNK